VVKLGSSTGGHCHLDLLLVYSMPLSVSIKLTENITCGNDSIVKEHIFVTLPGKCITFLGKNKLLVIMAIAAANSAAESHLMDCSLAACTYLTNVGNSTVRKIPASTWPPSPSIQ